MQVLIAVALGGAAGSVLRYVIATAVNDATRLGGSGTFVVNITGAFGLGLLLGLVQSRFPSTPPVLVTAIGAGFFGGFTTFSAFMWDAVEHAEAGRLAVAAVLLAATVLAGLLAMAAGLALGRAA